MRKKGKYLLKYYFAKEKHLAFQLTWLFFPVERLVMNVWHLFSSSSVTSNFAASCMDATSTALAPSMWHSKASHPQQSSTFFSIMKYILQMYIFIFPPDLMYRGHIAKASSVSRRRWAGHSFCGRSPSCGKRTQDWAVWKISCLLNHANCRIRQVINLLSSQSTLKASVKKAACVLHSKADTASLVTLQGLLKAEFKKLFSLSENCITSH